MGFLSRVADHDDPLVATEHDCLGFCFPEGVLGSYKKADSTL